MDNKQAVFSWLRAMSGGKLTQAQVDAGDAVIESLGLDKLAQLLNYKYVEDKKVSGQRDISDNGYQIIKQAEGFRSKAYQDTGGVWTIGYGTIKVNGVPVKKGDTCTEAQALAYLKADCAWVDKCLDDAVDVPVTQNQFDALASLVYNIGETAFRKSTLLKKLNAKDYAGAADQFTAWVYDNGKREQGLVNRRVSEQKLFLKP